MPSLDLSKLIRRKPDRPTLRQRVAALKAAVAKAVRQTPPAPAPLGIEPPRREVIQGAGAALTGVLFGVPAYRTGIDLSPVAEAWIDDARALGLLVMKGPDGNLWRVSPIDQNDERQAARDHHWFKLNDRPQLMRAVRAAVASGYLAEIDRGERCFLPEIDPRGPIRG